MIKRLIAQYEIDELEEGFQDVVEYHPTHKDSPLPIKDLVPEMTQGPLAVLRSAVGQQSSDALAQAFDALTAACNACHQTPNFGFNVVKRLKAAPAFTSRPSVISHSM